MNNRISIALPDGYQLVAEKSCDPEYPYEIYVGILDNDGVWHQDLAIIRNAYKYDNSCYDIELIKDTFDILVYGDKDNEDFTDDFRVELYNDTNQAERSGDDEDVSDSGGLSNVWKN